MRLTKLLLSIALLAASSAGATVLPLSDGSDGAFHPGHDITLDLPSNGVFNFTSIDIPNGVTVRFRRNDANTPVFLRAVGAVSIAGVIDVSAGGVNLADLADPGLGYIRPATTSTGGPGAGSGGVGGIGDTTCTGLDCRDAGPGSGLSGGLAGVTPTHAGVKVFGNAGGGGGLATRGETAVRYTAGAAGAPAVPFPNSFEGGSGGGGGSGWYFFGVQLAGGAGGGGGGALHISTPENITVAGSLLALGANGDWAFANAGGQGGPGGGGSGGIIALASGTTVTLLTTALVDTSGGYGGGLSTQTYPRDPRAFENGATGGRGYLYVESPQIALDGTLNASVMAVPEPGTWALMAGGLALVLSASRSRTRRCTASDRVPGGSRRVARGRRCRGHAVNRLPPRSDPTASGSCPSSSALPASGPTARSHRPR